jgi:hypothetical protein
MERLKEAAEVVADTARDLCPVGKINRPIYKKGKYAGKVWTGRTAGALKKTIRVVEKKEGSGTEFAKTRNVRVYAGNYIVSYARIVEYAVKAFMKPALNRNKDKIRSIMGGR